MLQAEDQMLLLNQQLCIDSKNDSFYVGKFVNIFVSEATVHVNVCDTSVAVKCLFILLFCTVLNFLLKISHNVIMVISSIL